MREATVWFVRQSASDFSEEERSHFTLWLEQRPEHVRAFQRVNSLWGSAEMNLAAYRIAGIADMEGEASSSSHRRGGMLTKFLIAASVLLSVMIFGVDEFFIWIQADYRTAIGEQQAVTLPDSSVATLNTNSAIALSFSSHARHVRLLRGEASFIVEPDPDRPFIVEALGATATALGTEFLVRERKDAVQVTVLHGSVEVKPVHPVPSDPIRLNSGNQILLGPQGPGAIVHAEKAASAAWLKGRLVFVGVPLAEVIEELSRYHRGYLSIWNPKLRSLPVTGIYKLENPERIVITLADTLSIDLFRITDHLTILR